MRERSRKRSLIFNKGYHLMPNKPRSPKRATIHDVARVAGVSKSTVSRVLNNRGYASNETVEEVQKAVTKLNYVPHASALGLVNQKTNTIGLAVNDLSTIFMPPLISSIEESLRAEKYNLLIASVGQRSEDFQKPTLGSHNTDGIIAFADSYNDLQIRSFYKQGFPIVLIHRLPPMGLDIPYINIENTNSTRELINHLIIQHRYKRIAFLRGPEDQQDSKERETGYRLALEDNGILYDPELVANGGFNTILARQSVQELLQKKIPFDAIFAGDDEAAISAIRELKLNGIKVPEDIAVVGFDDDFRAADIDPALTTVHVPFESIGRESVNALIKNINEEEVVSKVLETNVVIRKSCGCNHN